MRWVDIIRHNSKIPRFFSSFVFSSTNQISKRSRNKNLKIYTILLIISLRLTLDNFISHSRGVGSEGSGSRGLPISAEWAFTPQFAGAVSQKHVFSSRETWVLVCSWLKAFQNILFSDMNFVHKFPC